MPDQPWQGVLFDLDGTLHDRPATIRAYLAGHLRRFGLPQAYAERFVELDDFGYVHKRQVFSRLVEDFELRLDPEELLDDFYRHAWTAPQLMPGAHAVLDALRAAGLRLGVVTNGEAEKQRWCVERLDLGSRLDCCVISGEVGLAKPDLRIYLCALRQLGIPAEATLFVGDSPVNDVQGPQLAGLTAAHLPTSHPLPAGIVPEVSLAHLTDLPTWMKESRPPQR